MTIDKNKIYAGGLTIKAIEKLLPLFEVVAKANKFTHVKANIFKNELGQYYYLDTLGFHRQNQYANIELDRKEKELDDLIKKYSELIRGDQIGNSSRHKVLKIISRRDLRDKDKLSDIKKYLIR